MRRIALGIAALVLLWAPAADASSFTPEAETAYAYAVSFWELGEPSGCTSISKELFHVEPGINYSGEATRPRPGEHIPCLLRVQEGLEPCALTGVMVHEVGHLLGMGHSENPRSPMYPGNSSLWCIKAQDEERALELKRYLDLQRRVCPRFLTRSRRWRCWDQRRHYVPLLRGVETEIIGLIVK